LNALGADVYGLSVNVPTTPSHFVAAHLESRIKQYFIDVRDFEEVNSAINEIQPDFVFHLAAQPIVRDSFIDPRGTLETNIMGTTNVLESLRISNHKCTTIIITSDKCYDNVEWVWGYKETDALGGEDPYSASKGGAELVVKTYALSFFNKDNSNVKVSSVRAGNVIGGGDWANSRIVPDTIRAIKNKVTLKIRSPKATRPWQHVLEPLSGYLQLGQALYYNPELSGESFNFGPKSEQNKTVESLLKAMKIMWDDVSWEVEGNHTNMKEAGLLKLNCDKVLQYLNWMPSLDFKQTVEFVVSWYRNYLHADENIFSFTTNQISKYVEIAKIKRLEWTK
jgi:CDP-glucose 4,6-dehydratase